MGISLREWNTARFYAEIENEARDKGIKQGFAQGFEQRLAEWREMLRAQAAFRFGWATAEHLTSPLSCINNSECLKEIGRWIVSCETGDELLSRLNGSRPNGSG